MTAVVPDRLETLLGQDRVTGIDFITIDVAQTTLDVYFLRDPSGVSPSLVGSIQASQVRIYSPSGGERLAVVTVTGVSWPAVGAGERRYMRVTVSEPGDFSRYSFFIDDIRIDRYYNDRVFSFKVRCPTDLDCAPVETECPTDDTDPPAMDYLARDFWSVRSALLDFASQRYPDWKDRLEADAGVMLAEVMSALSDELAFYQDRVAREAHLETATQRRSVRRHARLVDYELHDGSAATAWLEVGAAAGTGLTIPAGTAVQAIDDAGTVTQFLVGTGLDEMLASPVVTYAVDTARDSIAAHVWDDDDTCLACGATELFIKGNVAALFPLDDVKGGAAPGRWVFLRATPAAAGLPEKRVLVRLIDVSDREPDGSAMRDRVRDMPVTRLRWEPEQALPFDLELSALTVRGNVLPAVAGTRVTTRFTIGAVAGSTDAAAVEREGANGSVSYLFTIPDEDGLGLCRRGDDPRTAVPEIRLDEVVGTGMREWSWCRSFLGDYATMLGSTASLSSERHFTLEDGTWAAVASFDRDGEVISHTDYKRDGGVTIRFGDGAFGRIPEAGTTFEVNYLLGNGPAWRLGADALTVPTHANMATVTNPLATEGGLESESIAQVRQLAPEAFRSLTYRAVRPEDYAEAAERLPWVQRAGAAFRWTGSWLTAFATPDPLGAFELSGDRREQLERWLDRFRQAGRETYVSDPVYANIDLKVTVRLDSSAYRGETRPAILTALFGTAKPGRAAGFFSPDNFTFGAPLYRSTLEAAIQRVAGVCAVDGIELRRRGWTPWSAWTSLLYEVAPHEIVRVENDPLYPERGSLRLILTGGA